MVTGFRHTIRYTMHQPMSTKNNKNERDITTFYEVMAIRRVELITIPTQRLLLPCLQSKLVRLNNVKTIRDLAPSPTPIPYQCTPPTDRYGCLPQWQQPEVDYPAQLLSPCPREVVHAPSLDHIPEPDDMRHEHPCNAKRFTTRRLSGKTIPWHGPVVVKAQTHLSSLPLDSEACREYGNVIEYCSVTLGGNRRDTLKIYPLNMTPYIQYCMYCIVYIVLRSIVLWLH